MNVYSFDGLGFSGLGIRGLGFRGLVGLKGLGVSESDESMSREHTGAILVALYLAYTLVQGLDHWRGIVLAML